MADPSLAVQRVAIGIDRHGTPALLVTYTMAGADTAHMREFTLPSPPPPDTPDFAAMAASGRSVIQAGDPDAGPYLAYAQTLAMGAGGG